jgi:hypothetical protein
MAGLIQQQMQPPEQMAQPDQMAEAGLPMGDQMAPGMESDEGPDDNDPAFQAALKFAMQALYESEAAYGVADALQAAPGAEGLANVAYEMTATVDERTDGQVPDELIVPLGMKILQEVTDIAIAAGIEIQPADVAEAFKQMILRFLSEQGLDVTELEQAMNQVDPQEFNKLAQQEA